MMTLSVDHLREEQDHICDCPDYTLGARDERVKLGKRFLHTSKKLEFLEIKLRQILDREH